MKTSYVKGFALIALVLAMVLAACSQPTDGGGGNPTQSDLTGTWITEDDEDYTYRVVISGNNWTMTRKEKDVPAASWENRSKGTYTLSGETITMTQTHKANQQGTWVQDSERQTATLADDGKSFEANVSDPYTYRKQ